MEKITRILVKTRVTLLAESNEGRLQRNTLMVYGVRPESKYFIEEVSAELGRLSNGELELYSVIDAEVVGTVTMVMDVAVFITYATIIDEDE